MRSTCPLYHRPSNGCDEKCNHIAYWIESFLTSFSVFKLIRFSSESMKTANVENVKRIKTKQLLLFFLQFKMGVLVQKIKCKRHRVLRTKHIRTINTRTVWKKETANSKLPTFFDVNKCSKNHSVHTHYNSYTTGIFLRYDVHVRERTPMRAYTYNLMLAIIRFRFSISEKPAENGRIFTAAVLTADAAIILLLLLLLHSDHGICKPRSGRFGYFPVVNTAKHSRNTRPATAEKTHEKSRREIKKPVKIHRSSRDPLTRLNIRPLTFRWSTKSGRAIRSVQALSPSTHRLRLPNINVNGIHFKRNSIRRTPIESNSCVKIFFSGYSNSNFENLVRTLFRTFKNVTVIEWNTN